MKIGKLSFGKRMFKSKDFKGFYCPLSKEAMKNFRFFWWFGHGFFVALNK